MMRLGYVFAAMLLLVVCVTSTHATIIAPYSQTFEEGTTLAQAGFSLHDASDGSVAISGGVLTFTRTGATPIMLGGHIKDTNDNHLTHFIVEFDFQITSGTRMSMMMSDYGNGGTYVRMTARTDTGRIAAHAGNFSNNWDGSQLTHIKVEVDLANQWWSGWVNGVQGVNEGSLGGNGTDPLVIKDFRFQMDNNGSFILDNLTVTEVPEPASMVLMGLGGLLLARRRASCMDNHMAD